MDRCYRQGIAHRQKGVVLLLLISLLSLVAAGGYLYSQSYNKYYFSHLQLVDRSLETAKQALLAYATNYADNYSSITGPGHLPCPDSKPLGHHLSGSPDSSCRAHEIGRLPIRWSSESERFEIYPFAEQTTRRFWYVSAAYFRFNGSGDRRVNSTTPAELSLDGRGDIVAVIIDPGPPLAHQSRPSDNPDDYLEGGNEIDDGRFVSASEKAFNDRLFAITRDELIPLVERRVLAYVGDWLDSYWQLFGTLPAPTPLVGSDYGCTLSDPVIGLLPQNNPTGNCVEGQPFEYTPSLPAWFAHNNWHRHVLYHPACLHSVNCGETIVVNGRSGAALLATFGGEHAGQNRQANPADVSHYLDTPESTDGDAIYSIKPTDAINNDTALLWRQPGA